MIWRKSALLLLCALLLGAVFASTVQAELVAYWPFDEGEGTVAADVTGNGNDGTIQGGATWVDGMIDGALQFNGSNAYVDAPHIAFNDRSFTVAAWINPGQTGSDHIFFSETQESSTDLNMHFRVVAGGVVRFGFYSNDLDSSGTVSVGNWYHIVLWYDFENQNRRIYINGVLDAEASATAYKGASGNVHIGQWNGGEYFNGTIDDVQVYDHALSDSEVLASMEGLSDKDIAQNPIPVDGADDVIREVVLSWTAGEYAATHDVYFGTVFDDVNDASRTNPMGVLLSQGQTEPTAAPATRLDFSQTYYWRVDEVNAAPSNTIFKGNVWSFTAEPYAYAIEGVVATSNTTSIVGQGPENLVNGSGLNAAGQHGTTTTAMWVGDPNEGESPYVLFEFDRVYKMDEMRVWNYNLDFEMWLGFGVKDATVEYSEDGVDWSVLGDVVLNQGPGRSDYVYNSTIPLEGIPAKYVRLNIGSSYLSTTSHGMSEVQFMYIPAHAREPKPADGATDVAAGTTLSWRSGREAASHEVYLATDPNALVLDGTTTQGSYTADGLELNATYYWQVNEVNTAEAISSWSSDLWSFSTQRYIEVEGFESYDDDVNAGTTIWQTWIDGFEADSGNGGALVGNDPSPFAELTIVHGGAQSMPLFYTNDTASSFSETDRAFAQGQDWTANGIQTLSLWFYGVSGNAGQLYVKINSTKVLYDGGSTDIATAKWHPWNIDLAAVGGNLSNVTSMSIGIDGLGAGTLYIDDIRLYAEEAQMVTPAEPEATGLAAHYTFDAGAGTTVADDSGNGNTGTIVGDPLWVSGYLNGAMEFSGDDYVNCGNGPSLQIQDAITITAWIKIAAFTVNWEAILAKGDDSYRMSRSAETGNALHFGCNGPTGDNLNGTAIITTDTWRHVAVVFDGAYKRVYVDGAEDTRSESTGQINISTFDLYIGENSGATGRQLGGLVDDVRIYNRALSAEELAGMAGRTTPIHVPF